VFPIILVSPLRQAIEARSLAGGCEADHAMRRPTVEFSGKPLNQPQQLYDAATAINVQLPKQLDAIWVPRTEYAPAMCRNPKMITVSEPHAPPKRVNRP
jgi:hypothetical protein